MLGSCDRQESSWRFSSSHSPFGRRHNRGRARRGKDYARCRRAPPNKLGTLPRGSASAHRGRSPTEVEIPPQSVAFPRRLAPPNRFEMSRPASANALSGKSLIAVETIPRCIAFRRLPALPSRFEMSRPGSASAPLGRSLIAMETTRRCIASRRLLAPPSRFEMRRPGSASAPLGKSLIAAETTPPCTAFLRHLVLQSKPATLRPGSANAPPERWPTGAETTPLFTALPASIRTTRSVPCPRRRSPQIRWSEIRSVTGHLSLQPHSLPAFIDEFDGIGRGKVGQLHGRMVRRRLYFFTVIEARSAVPNLP
jgi:hypothetical protein